MRKTLSNRLDLPSAALTRSTGETAGQLISAGESSWSLSYKPMLQLLGLTAGLTLSVLGNAVGMGGINVVSALGQPLKAEIELVAVSKADKPGLVARLASPDAYKGAGLDYPYGVKYSFQLENHANGEPYLKLSSNREINDPFVSLLVELSWASGKLMREYTFLLDPPGYVAAQPQAAAVQPLAPAAVDSAAVVPVKPVKTVVSAPPARTIEPPVEKKPIAMPVKSEVNDRVATGSVTVRGGDTLNKIAAQLKPDDVSLERMLVALYRVNADQFDGNNMNRIRVGKILRMPDASEVANLAQTEAVHEIRVQSDDWHAYRQRLASAATPSRQTESTQHVASGKISTPAADKTPIASESAKEVLRLSKGEAPGDKTGGAGRADKRNAAAEEAIAKSKAVSEEKTRAALLESNLKDMQRLAQLKAEAAALATAAAKTAVTSEVAAVSDVAAASAVSVASEVAAASAVASEVVAVSQVAAASAPVEVQGPSLVDEFVDSPLAMGVGAAVLLGLGGLGIALSRRKQQPAKSKFADDAVGSATTTGHLTAPVVPSPDTGDFTAMHSEEIVSQHDDVDPISEADLFLNFGRDEQAEEVLKDALLRTPDNQQVRLKLLGIYANRKDAAAFAEVAGEVQNSGDEQAIAQAAEMGRKFEQAVSAEAAVEDADSATMLTAAIKAEATDKFPAAEVQEIGIESPVPEVPLEDDASVALDFDITTTHPLASPPVDFDVTSTSPSLSVPDMLDFDISGNEAPVAAQAVSQEEAAFYEETAPLQTAAAPQQVEAPEEESLPNLDDLIFDVMSAEPATAELTEPPASSGEQEIGMEFTLDFPLDDIKEQAAPQPAAIDLSDISLDLDDVVAPVVESSAPEKNEHWHEVATKLDLAKAYQEMGDAVGAREILDEVMLEGDAGQQQEAELLIKQLG